MTITAEKMNNKITEQLDRLENDLPTIPAKTLGLGRATTRRVNDVATSVVERAGEFVRPVARRATTATKTVVGQARSAAGRSVESIRRGRNETVGQFTAQVQRSVETLSDETADLLDDATKAVAPETINPASLADLSKAELYERAQAVDIEGRSAMSKNELVDALRAV